MLQELWAPELLVSSGWQQAASGSHKQQRKIKLPIYGLSVEVILGLLDLRTSNSIAEETDSLSWKQ